MIFAMLNVSLIRPAQAEPSVVNGKGYANDGGDVTVEIC
jgi:hypothetical protein